MAAARSVNLRLCFIARINSVIASPARPATIVPPTRIKEHGDVEFRVQFLDALNLTNFFLANAATSASFGQTRTAFVALLLNRGLAPTCFQRCPRI